MKITNLPCKKMLLIVTKKSSNLANFEKKGKVQAPIIQSKGTIAM
jgi:hypothetical protein